MLFEFILVTHCLDSRIAARSGHGEVHGLVKELETLHFFDGLYGRIWVLEHDECLTFRFHIRLCDDINDLAISAEDGRQGLFELIRLDALLEISHVHPTREIVQLAL
jgi:hypothetical protein